MESGLECSSPSEMLYNQRFNYELADVGVIPLKNIIFCDF